MPAPTPSAVPEIKVDSIASSPALLATRICAEPDLSRLVLPDRQTKAEAPRREYLVENPIGEGGPSPWVGMDRFWKGVERIENSGSSWWSGWGARLRGAFDCAVGAVGMVAHYTTLSMQAIGSLTGVLMGATAMLELKSFVTLSASPWHYGLLAGSIAVAGCGWALRKGVEEIGRRYIDPALPVPERVGR